MPIVAAAQRRLRLSGWLASLTAGLLALAAVVAAAGLGWREPAAGAVAGTLAAVALTWSLARRAHVRWTPVAAAAFIEAQTPGLDNLVVTATAIAAGEINASALMRAEVERQAAARAAAVHSPALVPVGRALSLLLLALGGTAAVTWAAFDATDFTTPRARPSIGASRAFQSLRATVVPPVYLGRESVILDDPEEISVPQGARLRIEVRSTSPLAWLEAATEGPRALQGERGTFDLEWTPEDTTALVVAVGRTIGRADESRVLQVVVVPDQAPRIRVTEPGRDLTFGAPSGVVELNAEASDNEGLEAVRVAYIRMSGSGESFNFEEGQVPVTVDRAGPGQWRARARLSLPALKLDDGDSIVYRALVRDTNPGGEWVSSDAFTIDVGRRLEFAGAGSAVPDEDRRYALSQQMVIVKTERLRAERKRLSSEQWAERTRLLAMEQRMVRAEVVFLSGGEVQDEIEEAEHSHELQEGRLENAGRTELLRAINEMSRAEAELNGGDATTALVAERAALAALQRAFDRRRYFLRTLAERSRIDPARRLTGDRAGAHSRRREILERIDEPGEAMRELIGQLAGLAQSGEPPSGALVARLATLDPSAEWRRIAASLAAAPTWETRAEAARVAMAGLAARARAQAGASGPAPEVSPLRGWWADEWPQGRRR